MTDFQAIASDPERYADTMLDVLVGMGEDVAEDGDDFVQILAQAAEKYAAHVSDGRMRLYRAISVTEDWNPEQDGLGIFWSLTRERAYPYWAAPGSQVVIEGCVGVEDVNLWVTLATEFTALTEEEVRLRPSASVRVIGITTHDGRPILPHLADRTFHAVAAPAEPGVPGPSC